MKIFDAERIREIDALTIKHEPIESIDLMERAAGKCHEWFRRHIRKPVRVHVFCGPGNNGGDGLALSRMLAGSGRSVIVYKLGWQGVRFSDDYLINEKRLHGVKNLHVERLHEGDDLPLIAPGEVIVDAIFGNGLTRPVGGYLVDVINHINKSDAMVISIDMPSGLFGEDNTENQPGSIVKASHTLVFQFPKLSFLFACCASYVGEWHLLDIGLHASAIEKTDTLNHYLEMGEVGSLYRKRDKHSHKGSYGHALLIAGGFGKMGAAVLAARACLRSGTGLLTVALPGCGYTVMQTGVPEAMCIVDGNENMVTEMPKPGPFTAIAIGPGIGTHHETQRLLKRLIQDTVCPLVLDADAINILAENKTWLDFLPPNSIVTPHPGEFDRIVGHTDNDFLRFLKAKEFAARYSLIVILKGAHTAVISPDGRCFFNSTGNPGMATGGSGDVLTGMVLAWMAKGYSALHSAILAVYLHGFAGDLAAKTKGYDGLIAGDIAEMIPKAQQKVFY